MEELLRKLVEIPTVTGDATVNGQALDYIEAYLAERGMLTERLEFNGAGSLIATTRQTKHPKVLLCAHVDVVPAPSDQFKLGHEDGLYTGRGVYDMKYAIAVFMQLVDDLRGNLQSYDFGIMINSDEESGGINGAAKLVEAGYRADVVVLPDGGEAKGYWKLEKSAKGFFYKKVSATGKAAHGSRPWLGDNAIYKIIDFVNELRQHFPNQDRMGTTLNIGCIEGGEAPNQVPSQAATTLDIRFPRLEDSKSITQLVDQTAAKYDVKVTDILPFGHPHQPNLEDPLVKTFIDCFKKIVTDKELRQEDSLGGSDARFFAAVNVPCIVFSPSGSGLHADHESVESQSLPQLLQLLHEYLEHVGRN